MLVPGLSSNPRTTAGRADILPGSLRFIYPVFDGTAVRGIPSVHGPISWRVAIATSHEPEIHAGADHAIRADALSAASLPGTASPDRCRHWLRDRQQAATGGGYDGSTGRRIPDDSRAFAGSRNSTGVNSVDGPRRRTFGAGSPANLDDGHPPVHARR